MNQILLSTALTADDREELRLLYQVTVADIAFFKQQQWSITNYGLTIQAALVVATYQLLKSPFSSWQLWLLAVLVAGLPMACLLAIARLRRSIEARRTRLRNVRGRFGAPFNEAWDVPKENDDFHLLLIAVLLLSSFVGGWLVLVRA